MISPYRHATARKALTAALRGCSWLAANDFPTPAPIANACRLALSRGAAKSLDEQSDVERETTLNVIRGALASSSPDALALIERHLTREPAFQEPAPGLVPQTHWCRCGAHAVAHRGAPCPDRP